MLEYGKSIRNASVLLGGVRAEVDQDPAGARPRSPRERRPGLSPQRTAARGRDRRRSRAGSRRRRKPRAHVDQMELDGWWRVFGVSNLLPLRLAIETCHGPLQSGRYESGAPAYPPAMLLKVVRFTYSQGIVRSRAIERVCPRAHHVYGVVRHDRPARHHDRARCQHAARRHRPAVCQRCWRCVRAKD